MILYFYSLPFTMICSFGLGIFVLYKNPKNMVNQTWFLMSLSVAAWSLFIWLELFSKNADEALFFARLCNITASYVSIFFAHFCFAVTSPHPKKSILFIIGYLNIFIFTLFGFHSFFVPSVQTISVFKYYATPGPLYYYYTFHFFFYSGYGEFLLFKSLPRENRAKRNQIKYIMVATIVGFVTGGFSFLPVYGVPINPVSAHFIWLYVVIISFAIVKHKLLDINIVIRQGLIYSLLIGFITCFYFALVYAASAWFQNTLGHGQSTLFTITLFAAIALFFKPLERKIQRIIDLFIFKKTPEILQKENERLLLEVQKTGQMRAVATLAAGMAHEIKNPLTSIRTFAEFLPQKYDDPEFRLKFQRIVVDEVDRVNNIVKQLLEFSKPQELELKPCSIITILDDTLSLIGNNLLQNKIELVKKYSDDTVLPVDKNQLRQALLNLFLNSIQAMPGGGTLTVSTSYLPNLPVGRQAPDSCFLVTISDTGVGISKENLTHLFDPFFTTKEEGTGLGLSIVHSIITKHGGKIEVKSQVGIGTEFIISIPS